MTRTASSSCHGREQRSSPGKRTRGHKRLESPSSNGDLSMVLPSCQGRPAPLKTISENQGLRKKVKCDLITNEFASCFSSVGEESHSDMPACPDDAFEFDEFVTAFPEGENGSDNGSNPLPMIESFLIDTTLVDSFKRSIPASENEGSETSGSRQKKIHEAEIKHEALPTSPINSNHATRKELERGRRQENENQEKRMADRAARNRESSRRAREKAKLRLRSLESHNKSLLEMIQHLNRQNENLYAQLHRAREMQQTCTLCNYSNNATRRTVPSAMLPTAPSHDRCSIEQYRQQLRIDQAYNASL